MLGLWALVGRALRNKNAVMTSSLLFHIKHSPQLMVFFNLLMETGGKNPVLSKTEISASFCSLASSVFPLEQIIWKYSNTCCIDTGK